MVAFLAEAISIATAASAPTDRWGDYPTWVAGVGTVAAVVVALTLAGRDSRRRDRQQRRSQAELLTAWMFWSHPTDQAESKQMVTVSILNGSSQLAYRVIASLVPVRGTAPPNFRGVQGVPPTAYRVLVGELPPGRHDSEVEYPGGGGFIRYAVELAFRDAAGRKWLRGVDGTLQEIKAEPADHYGLNVPLDWYLFESSVDSSGAR